MIHTPPGQWPEPGQAYLESARFIDSAHPEIRRYAEQVSMGAKDDVARAVKLFYAVRDGWRYDPFAMHVDAEQYVASTVFSAPAAYCLPKAILLAALARAVGIPSAIGLSDVENHLTTDKLKARMGGKTRFINHGYAVLHVAGQWVKAAPAFNIELCERFHVHPTEFDGHSHSIFQEYDAHNRRHMEYVRDNGVWSDFPYEKVMADFQAFYPPETLGHGGAGERFEDGVPTV